VLGGTTEAGALAEALAAKGIDGVYSYAGRTEAPVRQPLPVRVGGFGGVEGLVAWLRAERISHLIDATHPFAARMSANAVAACAMTGTALIALERPGWAESPGDRWTRVADTAAAAAALPAEPTSIFLAIGRQEIAVFASRPEHSYLLRFVDPPMAALPLQQATVVVARGPFTLAGDLALMDEHRIRVVVAKNAGGTGARAKLDAARARGLPVILIDRPGLPERRVAANVGAVMDWLHGADLGV
jgi:precorrin-6A/cobalt-precorrin-6A reductase